MTERRVLGTEEFWRKYDGIESRLTASLSERMLDLAGVGPGMRVLDLATGPGEPALRAAQRVAPDGLVVGLDLDDKVLDLAREKAQQRGIPNLDLRSGDATAALDLSLSHFDAATVRWGLMYMSSPVAALVNIFNALRPKGSMVAALWAEPDRVPFYTLPRQLLERYRAVPAIDFEAPGPFRYADLDRITRDFAEAGFSLDHVEEMEVNVFEAAGAEEMIDWVRALGLTRLMQGLPEEDQLAWERDLAEALREKAAGGLLQLGGVTRIVVGRKT